MQVKRHYISAARGKLFSLNVAPPIVTECTIHVSRRSLDGYFVHIAAAYDSC
jgi:hypothetical protein